ncbi:LysR family transcriptional regulator [Marinobacter xestospongiae]|uniref:LysR family transcriptional regulator n=1 Tax=Marinobacter xestospongiae TaxID=994319 RepID=UPI0020064155|nr:LysR family transcriptional regulator [Marinobacter xestospongiae]MCK7565124.1 LysR family transcriptional regulator [Marinobacter xestospongiae]
MDIAKVDLNLLKLFDALLKEGSVTRAGQRLGLSQPAASRGLGRLRRLLNDQLLVRTATGWELTPRAMALSELVTKLLDDARAIVAPTEFDPATASGRLTIASADHLALLLMPTLTSKLAVLAPGIDLVIPPPSGDNVALIAQGGADLAIGSFRDLPARFHCRSLYHEDFVCVVRQGHPVLAEGLNLHNFAALSHLAVIITGQGRSSVDEALSKHGLTRRIAVRTPHFLVAPTIVAESDLILTMPRKLAIRLARSTAIEILEAPIRIEPMTPSLIWHERQHYDPAHQWLRQLIVDIAQAL